MENRVYIEGIVLLKKWHYLFLLHIKRFLEEIHNPDLSPRQALIIYCLGDRHVKIKDIIVDHFYEGCNPSYNIKKMTGLGYIRTHSCPKDRRIVYLSLGPKGQQIYTAMDSFLGCYHKTIHRQGLFPSRFHKWIKEGVVLETSWRKINVHLLDSVKKG